MRFRLAAIALTAAVCGLTAPARAADPAAGSDLSGYLPADTGYYVHINVRRFLAAPVIRTAIPMAADKFDKQLMAGIQMAAVFVPNAKDLPEDQIKQGLAVLKDPKVIAQAFDNAKDYLTDVYVAGVPGDDEKNMVVIKCHEVVAPELVKQFAPALQGKNSPVPFQVKLHEKGNATIYELSGPQMPQPIYITLPKAGVICISGSKDLVEKAATGATGGGLKANLQKLVATEKKTDFGFFATTGKGSDDSGVVSGWGRLVLNADIGGEVSATFANADKAAEHAKEMSEHLGEMVDKVKDMLGPTGKDVAGALEKAKPVTVGSTVTSKFSIAGSVVEKLLTKDR